MNKTIHHYLIGIGSNTGRTEEINLACNMLKALYPDIQFSSIRITIPVGMKYNITPFRNLLAMIATEESVQALSYKLKDIEKQCGRSPADKLHEHIPVDLDILQADEVKLKQEELLRPYYKEALKELTEF